MIKYDVKFNDDGTVTISQEFYGELFDDSNFLNCLRNAGIDNWDGYDEVCEEFNNEGVYN